MLSFLAEVNRPVMLAVDIGGTRIKVAWRWQDSAEPLQLLSPAILSCNVFSRGPADAIQFLVNSLGLHSAPVQQVAVSVTGLVDPVTQCVLNSDWLNRHCPSSPNAFANWDLKGRLSDAFQVQVLRSVVVVNDAVPPAAAMWGLRHPGPDGGVTIMLPTALAGALSNPLLPLPCLTVALGTGVAVALCQADGTVLVPETWVQAQIAVRTGNIPVHEAISKNGREAMGVLDSSSALHDKFSQRVGRALCALADFGVRKQRLQAGDCERLSFLVTGGGARWVDPIEVSKKVNERWASACVRVVSTDNDQQLLTLAGTLAAAHLPKPIQRLDYRS